MSARATRTRKRRTTLSRRFVSTSRLSGAMSSKLTQLSRCSLPKRKLRHDEVPCRCPESEDRDPRDHTFVLTVPDSPATHVPHADVPISAFGRCPGHPSRMTKRPYAGIGPSKPCVAGVYPACRKTGRSFRPPAGIPHGSARSGGVRARFGDRGAPNGSRRQLSIDMPHSCIRSSCAFVKRLSPRRGSTAAG